MESLQATTASTSISMVASSEVSRERMAGRDADYLWKEFFRDPSQFRDDPRRKVCLGKKKATESHGKANSYADLFYLSFSLCNDRHIEIYGHPIQVH